MDGGDMREAIKRWRCRHGLHKWEFHDTTDTADDGARVVIEVTTWNWCKWCNKSPVKINIARREFSSYDHQT